MSTRNKAAGIGAAITATVGGAANFADDAARVALRAPIAAEAAWVAPVADDAARVAIHTPVAAKAPTVAAPGLRGATPHGIVLIDDARIPAVYGEEGAPVVGAVENPVGSFAKPAADARPVLRLRVKADDVAEHAVDALDVVSNLVPEDQTCQADDSDPSILRASD